MHDDLKSQVSDVMLTTYVIVREDTGVWWTPWLKDRTLRVSDSSFFIFFQCYMRDTLCSAD